MRLYEQQSHIKRYLLLLAGGLVLLGILYVPIWLGFRKETDDQYAIESMLGFGVPGFIMALIGVVGVTAEGIKLLVLRIGKKT